MQFVPGKELMRRVNDCLTIPLGAGAAEVHLFIDPTSPGTDPTPSSFTEANFDGYASQFLGQFAGPYVRADGQAQVDLGESSGGGAVGWVLTADPVTPNIIKGYWVDYLISGVRHVLCYEFLPSPMPMQAAGNAVILSIPLTLPGPGSVTVIG